MSLTIPTTLPAVLELGHGLRLEFREHGKRESYTYAVSATIYEAWPPGNSFVTSGEASSAAGAILSLMADVDKALGEDGLPASVALALRDLAHQAVDIVAPTLSPESLESAVFAEPIPTPEQPRNYHGCPVCGKRMVSDAETAELVCPACPEPGEEATVYDPKTHQWKVGDWFMVTYAVTRTDLKFLQLCGAGPHKVANTLAQDGRAVAVCADKAGGWFSVTQIRPCAPPTKEAKR